MWSHRISWIYFAKEWVRGTLIVSIYGIPLTGGNREANSRLLLATYININALISTWIFLTPIQLTFLAISAFSFESPGCKKTWVYVFFSIPRVTSNSVHSFFFNCKLSVNDYFSCLLDMKLQGIVNLQILFYLSM